MASRFERDTFERSIPTFVKKISSKIERNIKPINKFRNNVVSNDKKADNYISSNSSKLARNTVAANKAGNNSEHQLVNAQVKQLQALVLHL